MHIRRSILEALRDQLNSLPGIGGAWIQRIPPSRVAYPSITLFASSENIITEGFGVVAREQERELIVSISAWIRGTSDDEKAEYDMDEAAEIIENTILMPSHATDMLLVSTDWQVTEDEPEIHVLTMNYQINYCSLENQSSID